MAQAQDQHPRVHPGGRLDGATDAEGRDSAAQTPQSGPVAHNAGGDGSRESATEAGDPSGEPAQQDRESERLAIQARQRRRRKLLHDCERLLLLDFDTLAMPSWPDHHRVNEARRRRDGWLALLSILSATVLLGLANLVPAVFAGVAFGLLGLAVLWGFPTVRHLFTPELSYAELLLKRRRLLHRARKHVEHLEGPLGLAASCRALSEFNPSLRHNRFTPLYRLSERGILAANIRTRARAQLYLIFALEAEQAYNRLRDAYLKTHEQLLEAGASEPLDSTRSATDPDSVSLPDSNPPQQ